ncbi:MAG: T9SS type A sorting domain-containing protein [Bacteroidetes bacterium]|nr:T9SS type A sorting domain-containing protein [Bacteroidota bacterium]
MKKILLVALILSVGLGTYAQSFRNTIPKSKQLISVPYHKVLDNQVIPLQESNPTAGVKSASSGGFIIGGTRYDAQSNGSVHERLWGVYNSGAGQENMAGIWTKGQTDPSYADRGTGYNYYNGTAWGPLPSSRIENTRTGWPVYQPWNGGGEIVVSHVGTGTSGLIMSTRPLQGTGTWTQSTLPMPSGVIGCIWPAMITSGPTHNSIHILTISSPSGSGGGVYQGLDGALLYYRSLDGGANWDKQGIILDPMTSANYAFFSGDEYCWGSPHGDTIYFVVGGNWTNTFIMKSFDNGDTWEYTEILSNAYKMNGATDLVNPFYCNDGSSAIELDQNGVFHVVFGRMCALDDGTGRFYRPYTDGLVYWNSTMPPVQDSLYLDSLAAHGQLLGYVYSDVAGDLIESIPYYGVGMTSFPQITVDKDNYLFVIWSGVTVGNPYAGSANYNYRHIWERHSFNHGISWSDSNDLNHGLAYIYKEFAYCAMVKEKADLYIRFLYQSADIPGSAIQDASNVAVHDNTIEVRSEYMWWDGNDDNKQKAVNSVSQNMPNPCHGITKIDVNLLKASTLSLDVYDLMGKKLLTQDMGPVQSGAHQFTIDGSRLTPGIYLYMVKMDNQAISGKMIVE